MTFYVRLQGVTPPPPGKKNTSICYLDVLDKNGNSTYSANAGETVKIVAYLFVPSIAGCYGGTGVNGKTLDFYWNDKKIGSVTTQKGGSNNWDGYAELSWTPTEDDVGDGNIVVKFEGDDEYNASEASRKFTVYSAAGAYWLGVITNPGWTVELYKCTVPVGCPYAVISSFGSPEAGWELVDSKVAPEDGKVQFTDLDVNTDYSIVVWDTDGKEVREIKITEESQFNKWYTVKAAAPGIIATIAQLLGISQEQAKIVLIGLAIILLIALLK